MGGWSSSPRMDAIFFDESSRISEKTMRHVAAAKTGALLPVRRIKPIDVPCQYCGVPAGEKCVRWNRRVKKLRRSPHPGRVKDTKLANQMFDALKPR